MSKYYRLELKNLGGIDISYYPLWISEIELLDKNESAAYHIPIPYHLEKTVTTVAEI